MINKIISFFKELFMTIEESNEKLTTAIAHQTEGGMAGAIDAPLDPRNIKHSEVLGRAGVPYNWRNAMTRQPTTIKDQGDKPSCGGQAGSETQEVFTGFECSADFIYDQIAYPGGGTTPQDLANSLSKKGYVRESEYPSSRADTPPPVVPDDIKAKGAKGMQFITIWADDLEMDTLASMQDKYGNLIISLKGQNNGSWLSAFPLPFSSPNPNKPWWHFMKVFDAYKDTCKNLVAQQSWGLKAGRNGVQVLREGHVFTSAFSIMPVTQGQPFKFEFVKDINFGDKSHDVFMLQRVLWAEGCFPVDPTMVAGYDPATQSGEFGNMTATAVRWFLRKKQVVTEAQIQKNGGKFVGLLTRAALNAL